MQARLPTWLIGVLIAGGLACSSCTPLKIPEPVREPAISAELELSVTPEGDGVASNAQIVVSFGEGVPPDVIDTDPHSLRIPLTITPDPGCYWRKLDDRRIACDLVSAGRLAAATEYRVSVLPGWKTASGRQTTATFEHGFRTASPAIVFSYLLGHASPGEPRFVVFTSTPVREQSLLAALKLSAIADTATFPLQILPASTTVPTNRRGGSIRYFIPYDSVDPIRRPLTEDPRYYVVAPSQPLPPGTYRLGVTPGLSALSGTVAGTEQRTLQSFESYGDFDFRGVYCRAVGTKAWMRYAPQGDVTCQRGSVQLYFSSAVDADTLNESTRIEGPGFVQGYLRSSGEDISIRSEPAPQGEELSWGLTEIAYGPAYRIRIDRLQDQFGRQLRQPVDVTVRLGQQTPSLEVPRGLQVFENDSSADVTIATVNADAPVFVRWSDMAGREQEVSLAPLAKPNDLLHLRRPSDGAFVANNQWLRARVASSIRTRGMQDPAEGSSVLTVSDAFLAQRTPFNVQWLGGVDSGLVWVTTLADAQPVEGASVEIFRGELGSAQSGPLVSAVTDANGLARIEYRWPAYAPADASKSEHYIEIKRGVQRAWLPWSAYAPSDCRSCDAAFPRSGRVQYRVLAFPSQPSYDLGELAQVVLVARRIDAQSNQPLTEGSYWLEFLDNEAVIADMPRIPVRWSEFGTAQFSVQLPDKLRSAAIGMRLTTTNEQPAAAINAGYLAVTPTQKPLYEVQTSTEQVGTGATVKVFADLFAGGPYVNAPTQIIAQVTPGYIEDASTNYPGFEFSLTETQGPYAVDLDPAVGTTGRDGQFQHEFAVGAQQYYIAQLNYEATVEDPAGRRLAARGNEQLFLRDRLIGINVGYGPFTAGEPTAIQAVVIGTDRKPVTGAMAVVQIAYNSARTLRPAPQSWRILRECTLRTGTAPVSCKFQPAASGYYRVAGSVKDSQGRSHRTERVRFVEVDAVSRPPYRGDPVELTAPKAVYVGDTMDVELATDIGRSTALVSVSTNRVLDAKVHDLRRGRKKFSIKVTEAMLPAFTVEAAVQVPRLGHLTPEQLRLGSDTLQPRMYSTSQRVAVYERALQEPLVVTTDRKTYAPGDTAAIQIRNQDPVSSIEVSLLVVDRSLLSLVANDRSYEVNPWEVQAPASWLSLITHESLLGYSLQGERPFGFLPLPRRPASQDPGADPPAFAAAPGFGSDAESSTGVLRKPRAVFRNVALWRAQIVLEPGQSQRVPVELPDNVGQWSIIAMAVDTGHRFQISRQELTVSKPLLVAPLLPSQLIAGDRLDAQFSVTNLSTQVLQGTWAREISGPLQLADGATVPALTLEPNQPSLVTVPVAAGSAGEALIKFGASVSDSVQDAIEVRLPIQRTEITETRVAAGQLQGGRDPQRVPLQLPADATPGSGKLDLYIGRSGVDLIAGAIASARSYPHACWEQDLTRAVSAALYVKLKPTTDPGFVWPDAEQVIASTLASAAKFQADNGGMTFFESSNQNANAYLTAYTLLAFDWLREFGYGIPDRIERGAIEYLVEFSREHPERLPEWAAALPLLTQRLQFDSAKLEQITATLPRSDVVTRSHLYSAVRYLLDADRRDRLKRTLSKELARELYFDQGAASLPLVSNEVAQCATIINLLRAEDLRALDGQITGLVRTLQQRASRRGRWSTTHENAFCAKALWDYQQLAQRAGEFAPIDVAATLSGRSLGLVSLSGSQSQLQLLTQPLGMPGPQQLEIRPTGQGSADYRAVLTYQRPAAARRAQASGFSLTRSYQVRRGRAWVDIDRDTPVEKSSLLKVNLDIVVPTARTLVALQDPLPAGVEILNALFATTSQAELATGTDSDALQAQYFAHHVVRRDSMNYYAENLPAGRYRVSYLVRAIAAGEFTALPPRIEEMYRPEIFGSAEVFRLKVQQPAR